MSEYPPKTDAELKLEEAKAKLAKLEEKKKETAQKAEEARITKQAEIDAIKEKLDAKKATSATAPTPTTAPTVATGPTTPTAAPAPATKTPEEIAEEERIQKQTEKQAKIEQKKKDIERILEDAKQTQQGKIEQAREIYLRDYKHGTKDLSKSQFARNFGKLAHFLGFIHKHDLIDTGTDISTKKDYNEEKDTKGDKTLENFVQKRVAERKAKLLTMQNPNEGNSESKWDKWTDHNIKTLELRYKKMLSKESNKHEAFNNKDLAFFTAENTQLNKLRENIWNDIETNRQQEKKDKKDAKEAHQKDILENGTSIEKLKVRTERLLAKSEYLINNKATRWAIGNKYARFALTTGAIGTLSGGLSTLFLANRIVRFGGGIIGGTIGKKIADAAWTVERTQKKRMEKLLNDFNAGKVSASEYDARIQEIERVINKQQHLYKMLATGTGAFAGGLGINKIDHTYLDGYLTNTTQKGLDFIGDKTGKGWDWAKDHMPWNHADTPNTAPQPEGIKTNTSSAGNKIPEKVSSPNPAQQPISTPNEQSIVHAGSGKGIEHAFRAQIEHDPALAEKLKTTFGYKGDISTQAGLHKFSAFAADHIARTEGYVSTDGAERFVHNTASYQIEAQPNGEIVIHEKVLDHGNWVETESSTGQFETDVDTHGGTTYESTHQGHSGHHGHTHAHIENLKKSIHKDFEKNADNEYIAPRDVENADSGPDTNNNDVITPKDVEDAPAARTPEQIEYLRNNSRLPHTQIDPGTNDNSNLQVDPGTRTGPRTRGDIQYFTPGQNGLPRFPEHDAGRNQALDDVYGKNDSTEKVGDTALEGTTRNKTWLEQLLDIVLGPEKPAVQPTVPDPLKGFDDNLPKAA